MINEPSKFNIRPWEPEDQNFVFNSWLLGLYYGNSWFGEIPKDVFMESYKGFLGTLLSKKETSVIVACLPDEPSVILGYAVLDFDKRAIHWVYVKDAWRKFGIARALLANVEWVWTTHLTAMGKKIKSKEIKFNPFIV